MIKSLSPYYVDTPFVNPTTGFTSDYYIMYITVYTGDKNTPSVSEDYTIRKENTVSSTGNDRINIGRIVNSFLDFTPKKASSTNLLDGDNQMWVYHYVVYSDSALGEKEHETTTLITKGYGYGIEGENPQTPSNKIMLTGDEFEVSRSGVFSLGIYLDDI